ncbi:MULTISPECIES: transposase [Acetobacter]|nr:MULTISPECIES: transposase [Acetobacter]
MRFIPVPHGCNLAGPANLLAAKSGAQLKAWNDDVHRTRGRIEKIFGTWKRSYGLRRMRWRGLAKAAIQIHVTAIAYNLRRTLNILAIAA